MNSMRRIENFILTTATLAAGAIWIFPLYWAFVTSIRSEENVAGNTSLFPVEFNPAAYMSALFDTKLMLWYVNSIGTAVIATVVVLFISVMCAYALSQIRFPGRGLLYGVVLGSFMVPTQALVVMPARCC